MIMSLFTLFRQRIILKNPLSENTPDSPNSNCSFIVHSQKHSECSGQLNSRVNANCDTQPLTRLKKCTDSYVLLTRVFVGLLAFKTKENCVCFLGAITYLFDFS